MRYAILVSILGAAALAAQQPQQQPAPLAAAPFGVEEATIAQIHEAMKAGRLTCRALVDTYLRRIHAYDKNGPGINALVVINPDAQKLADDLDRRYAQSGPTGPLHCIPAIVKDNFETIGLQSAGGSLSLQGFVSNKDAFQVKRIKDAGAIVLAKSNMAEFAFSPVETVNSLMPGYTRNPYALDRVTAGSSGGTAAAGGANFRAAGLGTDTRNSVRRPAPRHRHRHLDPRPAPAPQLARHPLARGADEPRRHRAAVPRQGRGRADGAHCCRRRGDLRRARRLRSGRYSPGGQPGQPGRQLPQVPRKGRCARRAARRGAPAV